MIPRKMRFARESVGPEFQHWNTSAGKLGGTLHPLHMEPKEMTCTHGHHNMKSCTITEDEKALLRGREDRKGYPITP